MASWGQLFADAAVQVIHACVRNCGVLNEKSPLWSQTFEYPGVQLLVLFGACKPGRGSYGDRENATLSCSAVL